MPSPGDADPTAPKWFLDALAAPVQTGSVEVHGCRIAFRRWGDPAKPGLLLVHGGGAHSRWWDHVAPFFSNDCCVTALDLSGHGDSGRRPEYHFHFWADEIAEVAVHAGAGSGQPPVIVAHSLGGFATLHAAAAYGDEFEGVVIVDSPVREPAPEQEASTNRQAFGPLRIHPTKEAILARFRPVPQQPHLLPYVIAHVAEMSVRPVDGGWTWKFDPSFFSHLEHFEPQVLRRVSCRVAILRPEFGLVTPDIGAHMYELLGRTSPVIEIPLAYHHVMFDEPLLLVTAVRSLLADWRHSYAVKAGS